MPHEGRSHDIPQKGMHTPEIESSVVKPPMGSFLPGSQRAICRSLIRENPVVAKRLCSPIQTARLFLAPVWPGASCTGFSCRTSNTRSFLSLDDVTRKAPLALHDIRVFQGEACLAACDVP